MIEITLTVSFLCWMVVFGCFLHILEPVVDAGYLYAMEAIVTSAIASFFLVGVFAGMWWVLVGRVYTAGLG